MASSSSGSPECVGFWKRSLATLIDLLIVFVVTAPIELALFGGRDAGGWAVWIEVVLPLAALLVFWRRWGATPGKMAISARIVDARSGAPPRTSRLLLRLAGYALSAIPFYLGFVWIAIDRRKQGWHDKIAGTMVIYDDD